MTDFSTWLRRGIKALLMGYVAFEVNGRRYWTYGSGKAARERETGSVGFYGYHIWRGWECFYLRRMRNDLIIARVEE